jgi:DNA-binding SARP family transcriptional activator
MEFRLFGEVQLRVGDQLLDLGTPRQQAVLAVLLVDAGRPVAIETLIDRVWGEDPPVEARNVLYSHLSRIRQLLKRTGEPARLDRRPAGYVLEIDTDLVDLHRFARLVEQGDAGQLTEALALWRGAPLAGIPGDWVEQVRDSWHRRRLEAVVRWAEAQLRLGHHDAVVTMVPDLVVEYPLAEQLQVVLMRALHAAGRDAEALDRYELMRRRLAEELGTDPGPELRALHSAILRGELPVPTAPAARVLAAPAQLPPDVSAFAGRDEELRRLDTMIIDRSAAAKVVTVSGTAGVGKSSLVVHWAHQVRGEFDGGQLYVNLRGFDPAATPVAPAEAIRGFLDAFEVPKERIPASFEAQVGLYRSLLTDRRVLVVLDNARDAEQVRPLLPGAPGCVVLVTSRNQLLGLLAEGAQPLGLDLLSLDEARDLLAGRIGAERVAAEPQAVDEIVTLCAYLPLALAVVAAHAATYSTFDLASLADELHEARGGLDEFAGTDPATDPRAVFSWSYLQLSPDAARMFRLLGVHPGPDITARAAASLAGLPFRKVRPLLAELAGAHLVAQPNPGRYGCHDLLSAYAAELVQTVDSEADRRAAVRRMLHHYIHSADRADLLIDPHRDELPAAPELADGVEPEQLADHARALAWFDAERRVLITAVRQDSEFDVEVWQLAWMMRRYLTYQGHRRDQLDTLGVALAAARRLGDPVMQAFAHCYRGSAYIWSNSYDEADAELRQALELYHKAHDKVGEAHVRHNFAWMLDRLGRQADALPYAQQSLDLFRAAGHQLGQAKALNAVGWFHTVLGDHVAALLYCQKALDLQTKMGDHLRAAQTWHSLGYVYMRLDNGDRAISCYQSAAALFHETGYLYNEANVMASLGDVHHITGNLDAAQVSWKHALDLLEQLGHPDADGVRAKLTAANTH